MSDAPTPPPPPVAATDATGPLGNAAGVMLVLESSQLLPRVDLLRTPLSLLYDVRSGPHRRFMMFMRRRYALAGRLYRVGALLAMAAILVPRDVGVALAVPAGLLTLPSWVMSLLVFSTDMMAITTRQFEFWYFSVLNVVTWGLLASFYWDLRAVSLLGACLGSQNVIFLDANFRTVVNVIKSSVVAVPALLLVSVMTFFRLVDTDDAHFRALPVARVSVGLADICANAAVTLAVFVARKAYNKRKLLVKRNHGLRIIRCVVFRARLVMRPLPAGASAATSTPALASAPMSVDSTPLRVLDTSRFDTINIDAEYNQCAGCGGGAAGLAMIQSPDTRQQVVLVPPKVQAVDVRRTLLRCRLSDTGWTLRLSLPCRALLLGCGVAGLVLTPVALLQHPEQTSQLRQTSLAVAALASTLAACVPVVLACQRDILRALLRNFDFLFVSTQFTLAAAMLCDMTQWTARSLAVLAWFVWFQTVLLADAVTPPVRRALGVSKRVTALPLALSVAGFVSLSVALLFQDTPLLADRTLVSMGVGNGRRVSMGTKSVLLNRVLTLVVWTLRLLWEAAARPEEELTFVRGSVEYYTPLEMFPPVSEVVITPLSILPAPAAEVARRLTHHFGRSGSHPRRVGSAAVVE